MDIQKLFFERVKQNLSPNVLLADEISTVLNIGSDSAYRRIRGKKELTLNEVFKLCKHFNISMNSIINYQSGNVLFKYTQFDINNMDNYYSHLQGLSVLMENMVRAKEKEMYCLTLDIPIPHFMPFLELTLFKVYTWFQSVNKLAITYDKFIEQLDIPLLTNIYEKIGKAYNQIPSTEIWTNNTIEPILFLLDYYPDLDCFEKRETFFLLCTQLLQMIENIEQMAAKESKEYKGKTVSYRMFLSPLHLMNDFTIAKRDEVCITAIKLYTINAIFTSDEYFCSEVEKWTNDLIAKSLSISGNSAKERFQFFQKLKNKVNCLMETKYR